MIHSPDAIGAWPDRPASIYGLPEILGVVQTVEPTHESLPSEVGQIEQIVLLVTHETTVTLIAQKAISGRPAARILHPRSRGLGKRGRTFAYRIAPEGAQAAVGAPLPNGCPAAYILTERTRYNM